MLSSLIITYKLRNPIKQKTNMLKLYEFVFYRQTKYIQKTFIQKHCLLLSCWSSTFTVYLEWSVIMKSTITYNYKIQWICFYPAVSQLASAFVLIPYSFYKYLVCLHAPLESSAKPVWCFHFSIWFISVNTHIIIFCHLQSGAPCSLFKTWLQDSYCRTTRLT